jgi:squalene synthase HpnC
MARARRENFRVASRLLPAGTRRHLLALYGFARLVDELGDAYPGDRVAALDWVEADIGRPGAHPLVAAAVDATKEIGADLDLLVDLVSANRQDQLVAGYQTFADLLAYCRLSANPVGRWVLAAFGVATAERGAWSDAVCTGLQLAEHWQDVAEDARAGRVYLPQEDLRRFGVTAAELTGPAPASPRLRALLAFEVDRARRWIDRGTPLVASLTGRARWAVAGFVAGGQAALDGLADQQFDPLGGARRPPAGRVAARLAAALQARPARPEAAA